MSSDAPNLTEFGVDEAEVKRLLALPDPANTVPKNDAVLRCLECWGRKQLQSLVEGWSDADAMQRANEAYCMAMLALVGLLNIRDFIACVSHGLLIGAIKADQSSKLLYAAQVALAVQKSLP